MIYERTSSGNLAFCAGAYKHKPMFVHTCFMFVWPLVNYLLGFSICLLTFIVNHSSNVCIQDTHCIGPLFLVSPSYFSIPPRATPDNNPLFLRYAYRLSRGFWEMDGLSGCVCCLAVDTLLSRVGCPFQWLRKINGETGPATKACVDNEVCDTVRTRVFS